MTNKNLTNAKKSKNDEFYTQYEDIEKEVNAYLEYNKNVFRNKTVLLPADNPFESNFFKFFAVYFNDFGLKRLIATSYDSSKAYKIDLTHVKNFDHDGRFNIEDVEKVLNKEKYKLNHGNRSKVLSYLKGDGNYPAGDFRSREVTKLRDEADIIITNPPFSLFREFMKWIEPTKRHFLVLGNNNAVTYKEIFPLIKNNIIWLGVHNGDMAFRVPDDYPPRKTRYWVDEHNQKWRSMGNIDWLTNLEHGKRHQKLELMTMEDNLRYNTKLKNRLKKKLNSDRYLKYDNYDAIEVPYTDAIPKDYDGVMGVPITFLDRYNPKQFEIVKFRKGDDNKDLKIKGKSPYFRILIKFKNAEDK